MALQEEIDAKRREIHTDGYPISIGELINLYRDGELDIHPEFQRFFRWSETQKSRLIESILLGIPIPSIFVNQREDAVWDVIDGLQRLSTIFELVGELKDEDGQLRPPLAMSKTAYLPALQGKVWESDTADSLSQTQRLLVKRSAIDVKIIKRESDPDTKFDLFQRLNTGGSQLSDQELRNCLLIMEDRTFYFWVKELQELPAFVVTAAPSDRAISEQYDLELVVRFLALRNASEDALRSLGDMADFLTSSALRFAQNPDFDRDANAAAFRQTFGMINDALSDDAFRRYDADRERFTGGFSVSAFEAISIGVDANLANWIALEPDERNGEIRRRAQGLWQDEVFRTRSGSGIRASGRVPHTIPRAKELFAR